MGARQKDGKRERKRERERERKGFIMRGEKRRCKGKSLGETLLS